MDTREGYTVATIVGDKHVKIDMDLFFRGKCANWYFAFHDQVVYM